MFRDPHSAADPEQAKARHLTLDLTIDMDARTLSGTATWDLELAEKAETAVFDTRGLAIRRVRAITARGTVDAPWELGPSDPILGAALKVDLMPRTRAVEITYATSPDAAGLQWLEPSQTAGKRKPFLYSQAQAILARTFLPCQDTPGVRITYAATLRVGGELEAVMSAVRAPETGRSGDLRVFNFSQPHPIPPYLVALAVGDLVKRDVGPRSAVWAEPEVLPKAAEEFSELERMIGVVEGLYGPYAWKRWDVLVLPPSFPFGGMENPMMTFVTPTLLAGDKSLVNVVVHELAHSWSGNLVTNATWNDFWLNEGFTVYLERRAVEALYGTLTAERQWTNARRALAATCASMKDHPWDTHLRLKLEGVTPDDGMTEIAYEKGALFLRKLEATFGRPVFDAFLKRWFSEHAFGPVSTDGFMAFAFDHLCAGDPERFMALDLNRWIDGPDIPSDAPPAATDVFADVERAVAAFNARADRHPRRLRGRPTSGCAFST
jgi:aminopeptidase N